MKILYTSRQRISPEIEHELRAEFVSLGELLSGADFVSLHAPLLPETHHLIGEKELKMMKQNACLINTARGPIVDERALLQALREGWIAGAALDVYENEPAITEGLSRLDNVIVLPHIGSASHATRERMAVMAATDLLAGVKGEAPTHLVNREILE